MTKETARIARQLRSIYEGPSWLGPSMKLLLTDVDETLARRRSVAGAHTIWELVVHMTAWLRIARERLSATQARDATPEEDWPAMGGSWREALASFETEVWSLERAIQGLADERLAAQAPAAQPQTFYVLLHGVIEHTAYHAGQIALLKKAR